MTKIDIPDDLLEEANAVRAKIGLVRQGTAIGLAALLLADILRDGSGFEHELVFATVAGLVADSEQEKS